ncbi:hypothetical protein SAMN05421783_12465 [Thiocapsa roseopersicina]|uniref:Uncharacterized protein n=1 Tax=Thiocapsa roseopersicina TaxID=1058 RepID=A0A1H3BFP0_THIRO|nr:hypothetical protein SAMN05421783_12465 [Thiocapsa roseopersicina]
MPPIVAKRHNPGIDDLQSSSSTALKASKVDPHAPIPKTALDAR